MQYPRLYIDKDGVERGYYVYAHKNISSGAVFYIGKGKNKRAWSDKRSNAWKEYVAEIQGGYEVLLLHQDLTEDESIDYERKEIAAYGGAAAVGGKLINWIPGEAGHGFGVAIRFELGTTSTEESVKATADAPDQVTAYCEARKYLSLKMEARKLLEDSYKTAVQKAFSPIEDLYWHNYMTDAWSASFVITSAFSYHMEIQSLCRRIGYRKLKWLDFCHLVDGQVSSLVHKLEKSRSDQGSLEDFKICREFSDAQVAWTSVYATGSYADADDASDLICIRGRYPINKDHDEDFERYVAVIRHFFGDRRADRQSDLRKSLEG